MSEEKGQLVAISGSASEWKSRKVAGVDVPAPMPGHNLDRQGLRVYDYLAESLIRAGRDVTAGGLQLVMLSHTITSWSSDMRDCVELGRYGTSEKGNRFELPHSFNERKARDEIMKWAPEACLTILSTVEAKLKESRITQGGQDDLFGDLVNHARDRPSGTG